MTYYVSKVFWLLAAPTNALVLISAIAAFWAGLCSALKVLLNQLELFAVS